MARPGRHPLPLLAALGWVAAAGLGSEANAQGLTPDPYNIVGEYNRQYEPYMGAVQPGPDSLVPNQQRMQDRAGFRTANRFQNYMESIDGAEPDPEVAGSLRRSGAGTPYFRAFRRYDQDFQRVYRPNDVADRSFYADQQQRTQSYLKALQERDPQKRAQLLREYNLDRLRSARTLSTARNVPEREPLGGTTPRSLLPGSGRPGAASPLTPRRGNRLDSDPDLTLPRTAPRGRSLAPPPSGSRLDDLLGDPTAGSGRAATPAEVDDTPLGRTTGAGRAPSPRGTAPRGSAPPPR